MTWNTRAEYHRLANRSATPLADKLNTLAFGENSPARTIIRSPTDLTPLFRQAIGDGPLLAALMANFYAYGRDHWSWTSSSTNAVSDGGLVKGNANFCACAGFNDNFAYLATNVLGIPGVEKGNANDNQGRTWIKGAFVTMPTDVIDSHWKGSVCSHNHSYTSLRMFKFTDHYFCNHHGIIYDVTANATHQDTSTMVAFTLNAVSDEEAAIFNGPPDQVYEVQHVSPQFQPMADLNLNIGRWILIALGSDVLLDGNNNRGFTRHLLTKQTKVGKSEIENFRLNTGRTSKRV